MLLTGRRGVGQRAWNEIGPMLTLEIDIQKGVYETPCADHNDVERVRQMVGGTPANSWRVASPTFTPLTAQTEPRDGSSPEPPPPTPAASPPENRTVKHCQKPEI